MGDRVRFRSFVQRLAVQEPLKIVFLGGSSLDGQSVLQSSESHLSHQIVAYLRSINPKVKLQFTAIPNVPLSYYSVFFDAHVDKDADLIFIDLAAEDPVYLQDGNHQIHEVLFRRAMDLPHRPPVIELMFQRQFADYTRARPEFSFTNGDFFNMLSQYYHQPWLSYRGVFWDDMVRSRAGWEKAEFFAADGVRPTARGHRAMAELLAQMVRREAKLLSTREPWGEDEEAQLDRALVGPLFENVSTINPGGLLRGQKLKEAADGEASRGFEWVDGPIDAAEGQGWRAREAGSRLVLDLDPVDIAPLGPENVTQAALVYRRAAQGVGSAVLVCGRDCSCTRTSLDGPGEGLLSQAFGGVFQVAATGPCRVEVLTSGEGEFLVYGLGMLANMSAIEPLV